MMSLRAVHAGSGYRYLLRSVATNDAEAKLEPGDRLHDYYAAKGTPAGKWLGSGLHRLKSETVVEGAEVTEDQMAALYGEGLHPDADSRMASGESAKDCKLGRAFYLYTGGKPVLEALANAERTFRAETGARPDEEERSQLALSVGRAHFQDEHGRAPVDNREIIGWVNREQDQQRQAVAGFDLTFSPVKSVSVLWALADKENANKIAAAHHEAVREAISWMEDNALFTRVGTGGVEQIKTKGLMASEFTHFDTRTGDPDLHSHVLVSNKVQVAGGEHDGQWKSIDGSQFFEHRMTAAGIYNTALQQRLQESLGIEFDPRQRSKDAAPVWEVSGISDKAVQAFSSRRANARPVYNRLVDEYVAKHKRQPSRRANYSLWQAAILETRDAKKPAETLDALRAQWSEMASSKLQIATDTALVNSVRASEGDRELFDPATHITQVSDAAIASVLSARATFKKSHLHTAVSRHLHGVRFESNAHRQRAYSDIMNTILGEKVVSLTPPETLDVPRGLTRSDGTVIDVRNNSELFSTSAHLAREERVLDSAQVTVPVFASAEKVDAALAEFSERRGFELNDGQEQLARHLVGSGTLLAVGVGPAGTGKTTAMEVVTDVWRAEGGNVIGLAPSAAAAKVLESDIGTECHTIDRLTFAWNQMAEAGIPVHERADELPVSISSGDMLLVDEAGMASTDRVATLIEIAEHTGAVIRMVGDPAQLDAVETGGVFRTLCADDTTPVLRDVLRMGDDHDQAQATLSIRDGDTSGLDLHFTRKWVESGARDAMVTSAVDAYLADTEDGKRSLVIAPTNADVATMNELIRAVKIDAGTVSTRREAQLSDGLHAGKGDVILARKNKFLTQPNGTGTRVMNGQMMTVRKIRKDGSIDARDHANKQNVHLPAWYVDEFTQLGYASTIHRCQGATVDTTHCVVDASLDRNALYVALTRGKVSNKVYVDLTADLDENAERAHVHHSGDDPAPTARGVLESIVDTDNAQRSATDTIKEEFDKAHSPERRRALYNEGVARATRAYVARTVPALVDSLPAGRAAKVDADTEGVEAIEHAATWAANRGLDVRRYWPEATKNTDWADSPGRLIASRLRHMTKQDAPGEEAFLASPPPVIPGSDPEMALWLEKTHSDLSTPTDTIRGQAHSRDFEHQAPTATTTRLNPMGDAPTVSTVMGRRPSAKEAKTRTADAAARAGSSTSTPPRARDIAPTERARTRETQVRGILAAQQLDQKIARYTRSIDTAITHQARTPDDALALRIDTAQQELAELTKRQKALEKNLPDKREWPQILRAWNNRTTNVQQPEPGRSTNRDQGMDL